jgi:hypothetical protein
VIIQRRDLITTLFNMLIYRHQGLSKQVDDGNFDISMTHTF